MVDVASKLYGSVCTIIENEKYISDNGATNFRRKVVVENEPCRLSYSSFSYGKNGDNGIYYSSKESKNSGNMAYSSLQVIKLFIRPDIKIKNGSRVIVEQNGIKEEFINSGKPAVYSGHQEVMLMLKSEWA